MKTFQYLLFAVLITCLTLPSCVTSEYKTDDLLGHWEVVKAEREGKTTESLIGIYMEYKDGGIMLTNFNEEAEDVNAKFELIGNTIEQQGENANSYLIDKLEGGALEVRTTMMNLNFKLFLEKR